jgi:hypothetical protein
MIFNQYSYTAIMIATLKWNSHWEGRFPREYTSRWAWCKGWSNFTLVKNTHADQGVIRDRETTIEQVDSLRIWNASTRDWKHPSISWYNLRLWANHLTNNAHWMTYHNIYLGASYPAEHTRNKTAPNSLHTTASSTHAIPPPLRIYSIAECTFPAVARKARTFCDALVNPMSWSCF